MQIAAFRPLRYNPEHISYISRVVAPPYDVIEPEEADELRERDPHNIIRLILGKEPPDGRPADAYQQAAETLAAWRREEVLIREPQPCIYVCEQQFELRNENVVRRGFLSALSLEEAQTGRSLPHENTLAAPRADREALVETCGALLSPVFGICDDPNAVVDKLLASMVDGIPLFEFQTPEGIVEKLWVVTDTDAIRELQEAVRERDMVIADGHHRYQTACQYRGRHRDPSVPPGQAPEDYVPAYCVSVENSGLVTLPTHRLVRANGRLNKDQLLQVLSERFDIHEMQIDTPEQLLEVTQEHLGEESRFGCYLMGQQFLILTPGPDAKFADLMPDHSLTWRRLPVSLLHYGIIEPVFGVPADSSAGHPQLAYAQKVEHMYWQVESAAFDAGFPLPPISPTTIQDVARAGERMPPKSTYFHPKVLAGLAIYPFEKESVPEPTEL